MFYSPSTGGFYDPTIHDVMPDDVVEVSKEQHAALFEAQASGFRIAPDAQGHPVAVSPAPPTHDEKVASFTALIQSHLDEKARAFGYDDIKAAVTYADEPAVPKFQAEGLALRAWRSEVWAFGYALLADVAAGNRAEPTPEQLLAALPVFVLS